MSPTCLRSPGNAPVARSPSCPCSPAVRGGCWLVRRRRQVVVSLLDFPWQHREGGFALGVGLGGAEAKIAVTGARRRRLPTKGGKPRPPSRACSSPPRMRRPPRRFGPPSSPPHELTRPTSAP